MASCKRFSPAVRFLAGIATVGAGSILLGQPAFAGPPDAWSTTPADGTFTGNNWTTGTATPGAPTGTIVSGDTLNFGTSTITTLTNDEAPGFNIAGLIFGTVTPATVASAYTISGNDFVLSGGVLGIFNTAGGPVQTINNNFSMTATQTLNGNLTLNGVISGTGGLIFGDQPNDTATFRLNGNNTYTGGTIIENSANSGATPFALASTNTAFGTGAIQISPAGNTTNAKLGLSNNITLANTITLAGRTTGIITPGIESVSGANTLSSTVTLIPGGSMYTIQSDAGSTLTLANGAIVGGGAGTGTVRNLTFTGAGNGTVNNAISNGSSLVTVSKTGAGTWTFTGTNTYTNGTTVTAGTLAASSNGALSTGLVTLGGGTLAASTSGLRVTTGALAMTASSILDFGLTNTSDVFSFTNSSASLFTGGLSVYDWKGLITGGGPDQLFVGTSASGLTATQLSQITFYADQGTTSLGTARILGTGEVVASLSPAAAPEPSQFAAFGIGLAGLGVLGMKARRRSTLA